MAARSAGVLLYRRSESGVLVLLAHPGGPFWRSRDAGAWMIPKGEMTPDESAQDAARRELEEELGRLPSGTLEPRGSIRQSGGK
ncbi:MAG TPA: NUDIX domain-containing protein, partial [Rhodanobacteraceae bacterium]|nr:NUDIX domain-containing protein [Rhodanobacteraceae bacterium]